MASNSIRLRWIVAVQVGVTVGMRDLLLLPQPLDPDELASLSPGLCPGTEPAALFEAQSNAAAVC